GVLGRGLGFALQLLSQSLPERGLRHGPPGHRASLDHRAVAVQGVGGAPEADHGFVGLVVLGEIARELGGFAKQQDEYAGRHRVEGASVPYAARVVELARSRHKVKARRALGLVDDQYAVRLWGTRSHKT